MHQPTPPVNSWIQPQTLIELNTPDFVILSLDCDRVCRGSTEAKYSTLTNRAPVPIRHFSVSQNHDLNFHHPSTQNPTKLVKLIMTLQKSADSHRVKGFANDPVSDWAKSFAASSGLSLIPSSSPTLLPARLIAPLAMPDIPPTRTTIPPNWGTVLICQQRTCLQQGAAKVLQAFQAQPVPGYAIAASTCMGQCGNGPMVRILPDNIWYSHVQPDEVAGVIERHLRGGKPIRAMLYRKFHS